MDRQELQKLRDLPIEGVAERLGLRVVRHKCLCPFHDDHHASLSFRGSKNTFRCFVCGASGGTIDLVMRYLNKDFKAACQWLSTQRGRFFLCTATQREPSPVCGFDASRYSRFFEHPWLNDEARRFLFEERRIDPRVARWCRITSWKDRQGVPWLQTPYYDREGRLIGVQNRNLIKGALPRFRFPQGAVTSIYNLPVLNRLKAGDELYIAEGCSDCWSLLSAGHKAIAIPSATLLTRKDIELLEHLGDSPSVIRSASHSGDSPQAKQWSMVNGEWSITFHMYPDNDVPGERLFLQLREVLPTLVRHQLPPDCKDFSEYYLKQFYQPPPAPPF